MKKNWDRKQAASGRLPPPDMEASSHVLASGNRFCLLSELSVSPFVTGQREWLFDKKAAWRRAAIDTRHSLLPVPPIQTVVLMVLFPAPADDQLRGK